MAASTGRRRGLVPQVGRPRLATASYRRYDEAETAVDRLLEQGVPADRVAIVASDLRFVEEVTGRFGYAAAAGQGATAGAAIGALFGLVAGLLRWIEPLVAGLTLGLYGLALGALLGALVGAAIHRLTPSKFASTGRLDAARYDVMVDEAYAATAAEVLVEHTSSRRRHEPDASREAL